ncbi:MAG: GNAT family N-acetyltransferase [Acidobacteria bacterium]|nr:GNAT family N-acetyltransferase [Acidobacteriota bacterium]
MSFQFRPYSPEDREACLALFTANTPNWFAPHEREQYESFLDEVPGSYYLMYDDTGALAGAGGVELESARGVGWLTWGMVDPNRHGQGLGKTLLEFRLEQLRANLHIHRVCIDSSQHTAPFYEKYGFTTQRIIPDGYAKGLHRHEMELRFTN